MVSSGVWLSSGSRSSPALLCQLMDDWRQRGFGRASESAYLAMQSTWRGKKIVQESTPMKKQLIITADDFGLHELINVAVESAARQGALTAASLMVAAPATADAVRRAAGLSNLRVGLHVVLADGRPILDPNQVATLVGNDGRMGGRMGYDGLRYFLSPRARIELEAEVRAQFAAFARTGLQLDHVNAHKHFHMHPTILGILLRVGREYGSPPVRATREPLWFARRNGIGAALANLLLRPWVSMMMLRLRWAGVRHNDSMFGVSASGAMDEETLLEILARLPRGVSEIYLHPAKASGHPIAPSMNHYRHDDEFDALLSPRVQAAIMASGASQIGFGDLSTGAHRI
jgi:chitin disaccharide deacetylase